MKYKLLTQAQANIAISTTPTTLSAILIAAGLTDNDLLGVQAVEIQAEGEAIRYSLDGSAVTAGANGFPLGAGVMRIMRGDALQKMQIVAQAGTPVLHIAIGLTDD